MLKAVKGNKVYKTDEAGKKNYLAQGFDIYDDKGKVVEKSPQSTVSYEAYSKLEAENKALKAEIKKLKDQVKEHVPET
ncbi:MAG: hypothetical protein IJ031_09145 [Oscillospiraceae bacterium]|nr:hypothetical protein [Oscillospiraceae bacterium]MBQ8884733.1 hypothetical protein [Oscillospiraceae bacterium]